LAISKHTTELTPPLVPGTDDFTERYGLAGEFSANGSAQKLV
jgi:hypothetical protein